MSLTAVSIGTVNKTKPSPRAIQWMNWRTAGLMIVLTLIARLVYLIWFCPYQLLGDEAYYWEGARHLAFGYTEKGPLLAWMIAGCCRIFGDTEWAVRLPVVIASALAAWGIGKLTMSVTRGSQRAGFLAVLIFILLPAFQANAQICTQDGVLIALWIGLTATGLRLFRRWHGGQSTWREWILLWVLLGVGVILKQSVLVFLPSLVVYWWMQRRELCRDDAIEWKWIAGVAIVTAIATPMIVWNARNGWPMLEHTLGHLGAGGDQAGQVNRGNPLTWIGATIGGMVGAFGLAGMALFGWSSWQAAKSRREDLEVWRDRLWLMCAAWPSVAFFVLLSLKKPVVPSWPLPSMTPLVVLAAEMVNKGLARDWKIKAAWWGVVVYGIGGWFLIAYPTLLGHLPVFGNRIEERLIVRFTGHREAAAELQRILPTIRTPDGRPPVIVTRHYMQAALYSFYLPGHPAVMTAGTYLGKRSTTYDHWEDTNMENPALFGRTLLLDGEGDVAWEKGLKFDRREAVDGGKFFLAENYQGPRADHPRGGGED